MRPTVWSDENAPNTSGYPRRRLVGCRKPGGGGWGDMDLMATDISTQRAPIGGSLIRRRPPFYSWFHTNDKAGVDVFSRNVDRMPRSLRKCFGYCFPQPSLVGVVLAPIGECEARPVIVVPNTRALWFPMIEGLGVRSLQIASQGEDSQLFWVHHQRRTKPYTFGRRGMRAVEVDFRENV